MKTKGRETTKLIAGELYADVKDESIQTVLRFLREKGGTMFFKYHSGKNSYGREDNGEIRFSSYNKFYNVKP
jgi:hypothetical protein